MSTTPSPGRAPARCQHCGFTTSRGLLDLWRHEFGEHPALTIADLCERPGPGLPCPSRSAEPSGWCAACRTLLEPNAALSLDPLGALAGAPRARVA